MGIQTGRTWEEALIGREFCKLDVIPETSMVTKRDGFHKPKPGGLALLASRLGFHHAIYIGDALDDLKTVQAFNAAHAPVTFLSAQVLTGPAGKASEKLFANPAQTLSPMMSMKCWIGYGADDCRGAACRGPPLWLPRIGAGGPLPGTIIMLPITRVTLYTSGVGYFERGGDVNGEASLTLFFPVGQVNDVLKSLTLLDGGGGTIQPVTYAAQDPVRKALQAFSMDVSDNPNRAALAQ